jgi:hypothetical protein
MYWFCRENCLQCLRHREPKKGTEKAMSSLLFFTWHTVLNFYTQLNSHPDSAACINLAYTDRESYTDNSGSTFSLYLPYREWRHSFCSILQLVWKFETLRPKARGLSQHGGPPGWQEESDPAGVILYVMDGPYRLPFAYRTGCPDRSYPAACWWNFQLLLYSKCTQPSVMTYITQGRHNLVP